MFINLCNFVTDVFSHTKLADHNIAVFNPSQNLSQDQDVCVLHLLLFLYLFF